MSPRSLNSVFVTMLAALVLSPALAEPPARSDHAPIATTVLPGDALPGESAMPAAPHPRVAKEHSAQRGSGDGVFDPALSIDSIRHRVAPSKQTPGALESVGRLYRARFTDASIDLSLRRTLSPRELQEFTLQWRARMGARKATTVRGKGEYETPPVEAIPFEVSPAFSLSVTGAGTEALTPSPGPWRGEFNRALREIAPGLTERVTVLESGAEWD